MCGFKPGDEVVCVESRVIIDGEAINLELRSIAAGATYVIDTVWPHPKAKTGWLASLAGIPNLPTFGGYSTSRFRKVERKSDSLSIEAFLTIKPNQFEGPTRTNQPAKRKEQA